MEKIKEFVLENISFINDKKDFYGKNPTFTELQIKKFLKIKIIDELKNEKILQNLLNDFKNYKFKKSKIPALANKYVFYKSDLKKYLKKYLLFELAEKLNEKNINILSNKIIEEIIIISNIPFEKFNFIKPEIKSLLEKSLFLIAKGGFVKNLMNINEGIMTANAGDSAQFLFVSRAILAGFNCSNVDVWSSKYDAIIDINNFLLRIQIKGVEQKTISFFDRPRGGQGIDHKHERNIGKRITKNNCDLYVVVDKQIGICYIIPMDYADNLTDQEAKAISLNKLQCYKENWNIIKETAQKLNKN